MKVAIVGGGAAGFFSALSVKQHHPSAEVIIFEKSKKVLAKVKVSGGGRCNVTHACYENKELAKFYPRGEHFLRKAFEYFNTTSTINWFEDRGVKLITLPDNCIFPKSDSSQTIIDCFLYQAQQNSVVVEMQKGVSHIKVVNEGFWLHFENEKYFANKVIITTGGHPKKSGFEWLEKLGVPIISPVPSLFTFNMPDNEITKLMGIVVNPVTVKVEQTKLQAEGPLLITHWGMSGPAILKLSAFGARLMEEKNYSFFVLVNWLNTTKEDELRISFEKWQEEGAKKKISNWHPFPFPNRLWMYFLEKSETNPEARWNELGKKSINRLINLLINDRYQVNGKTTFKEEFVTAGGVDLKNINVKSMESKNVKGLYFAGEVMDIDGVTGGFNFQAAWTTGFIAGKLLEE